MVVRSCHGAAGYLAEMTGVRLRGAMAWLLVAWTWGCAVSPAPSTLERSPPHALDSIARPSWSRVRVVDSADAAPQLVSGLAFSPSGHQLAFAVGNERDGVRVWLINADDGTKIAESKPLLYSSADDAIWIDDDTLAIAGHASAHLMQSSLLVVDVTSHGWQVRSQMPVVLPSTAADDEPVPAFAVRLGLRDGDAVVVSAQPVDPTRPREPEPLPRRVEGIELSSTGLLTLDAHELAAHCFSVEDDSVLAQPRVWRQGSDIRGAVGQGGVAGADVAILRVHVPVTP